MIRDEFLIYSTRMNAWVGKSGTGTSDHKDAQIYTRERALAYCRRQRDGLGRPVSFPVELSILEEVRQ